MRLSLRVLPLPGLLLLTALLMGCLDPPAEATEVTVASALAFEDIGRGQHAALDTTGVAIRDADAWAVYQDSLQPLLGFREVDFSQEMVLLAAVPVPTGGYDLRIESVEQAADSLLVRYLLATPADDCRPTMGAAVVFQAVRVARIDAPLRFERTEEAYRCTQR